MSCPSHSSGPVRRRVKRTVRTPTEAEEQAFAASLAERLRVLKEDEDAFHLWLKENSNTTAKWVIFQNRKLIAEGESHKAVFTNADLNPDYQREKDCFCTPVRPAKHPFCGVPC